MSYSSTSAAGYAAVQSTLAQRQQEVLTFLKSAGHGSAGYSNRQIAQILGRPINAITPRVLELRQDGFVELAGYRKDAISGVTVKAWKISKWAKA